MISNLIIFFYLISQVNSLRIFQSPYKKKLYNDCNKCIKNKVYEVKKFKNDSYDTKKMWKDYENDVDPPIIFEQYNYPFGFQNNSIRNK